MNDMRKKLKAVGKLLTNPDYRFCLMANRGLLKNMPAADFLRRYYLAQMGKPLNLENPVRYTEKLQWLKLWDHRPEYTTMVDKYAVKAYVAEKIGPEYVVPLLGAWDRAEDIDFDALPERFVLKTTHDSGGIVVCRDKASLDIPAARRKLRRFLKRNYYDHNREWPYKNVKPRIISEAFLEDSRLGELRDYKFFTFGGEPKVLYIAQGRGSGAETTADFFDMEFRHLPFTIDHDMAPIPPEKPENFELMQELARKLSRGTPQLRVDFYEVDGKVYFGEMTFFHCTGMHPFHPEEWDYRFGEWVTLPDKNAEDQA